VDADVSEERKPHISQQFLYRVCSADVLLGQGLTIVWVAQWLGISAVTYQRWGNQYGVMKAY